jgi:hypothetical protein
MTVKVAPLARGDCLTAIDMYEVGVVDLPGCEDPTGLQVRERLAKYLTEFPQGRGAAATEGAQGRHFDWEGRGMGTEIQMQPPREVFPAEALALRPVDERVHPQTIQRLELGIQPDEPVVTRFVMDRVIDEMADIFHLARGMAEAHGARDQALYVIA